MLYIVFLQAVCGSLYGIEQLLQTRRAYMHHFPNRHVPTHLTYFIELGEYPSNVQFLTGITTCNCTQCASLLECADEDGWEESFVSAAAA